MVDIQLYHGDCLEILPTLPEGSVDACITDPPYGCGKADWDDNFPVAWYTKAKNTAKMIVIITGSQGLFDSMRLVGDDFIDVVAGHNMNALTRGPLGFNNWLAAVVSCEKPKTGNSWNCFEFAVRGDMPDHPSPKPIEYMTKLVDRLTKQGDTIIDPFMGSGTTGVACVNLNRNFIGIEKNETYFNIARKRIEQAQQQLHLLTV